MASVIQDKDLQIFRSLSSVLSKCSACDGTTAQPPGTLLLVVQYDQGSFTFCPGHEALLLSRLLGNYIKRTEKKINRVPDIPKDSTVLNDDRN